MPRQALDGLFAGAGALRAQQGAREGLAEAADGLHRQNAAALGFEYASLEEAIVFLQSLPYDMKDEGYEIGMETRRWLGV